MDEKGDPSNEEVPKAIKPTSKEFRKTWGFRRTTIAKREGAGDADLDAPEPQPQQQQSLSLRRSGRQPKRTERVEEFLTTVRRRGRKNAPVSLEDSGEAASCAVTDVETASEGSVESTSEGKGGPPSGSVGDKERPAASVKAKGGEDEDDTSDSDSDGLTLKELQNRLRRQREQEAADRPPKSRLRKKRREQDPTRTVDVGAGSAADSVLPHQQEPEAEQGAAAQAERDGGDREPEGKAARGLEGRDPRDVGRQKPECEAYEPNALYCICRQPHNNRFMICCDRCEEWFHGDCVGISEARGRLLERNGEDYICPNCTILQVQDETNSESAEQQEAKCTPADGDGTDCTSMGTVEQKSGEDQGIKGRIEKAANPSGKKKLKIFQPVAEAPGAAKCIGPGCSSAAQPDSVYCSSDCILKHAAATMKFLSSGKEQKPKPKEKTKTKPEKLILPKCSVQAGIRVSAVHKRPAPDKKENTVKKALVAPSRSEVLVKEAASEGTPSWASDHNYNAVKPEQTAALWPPLLYKSAKEDRRAEERTVAPKRVAPAGPSAGGRQPAPRNLLPKKSPPFANTAAAKVAIKKSPSGFKGPGPKRPWLSTTPSSGAPPAKQAALAPGAAASKKLPSSATLVGAVRKPGTASVPLASQAPGRLGTSNPALSQPNSQIRQNIRRSLKEILWKRVNDSDDLIMTESEVGKIALHIEKEMFNLFQVTDNRYKSRYRSIMFNLKDPKNQGLFHRVLREEISSAKLVRMKPEELASKELSTWRERPAKPVLESRNKLPSESKKTAAKQESVPDMEDSPPVSDSDEQQESVRAVPDQSAAPLLDVFSSMLKDTTGQHRAHLFDLNCKICTGQVPSSEDEPAPKKQKLSASKKEEPKPQYEPPPSEPVLGSANEAMPETLPESASEPDLDGAAHAHLERKYFPVPPGDSRPEPSALEGPSCPATCGGSVLTTVTVSGRDPRTASSGSCTVTAPAAARPDGAHPAEPRQDVLKPAVTSVTVPKSILAKPSPSPEPRYLLPVPPAPRVSLSESRSPPEGDTTLFLSRLSTIWKGFINMQSVAKFVTKAYPVSGCCDYLSEDLPDTIHIGGRITPRTVWDYVGKLKSSVSKELCLIRFHPATEEEEVAYISLYSYFSSRGRFGVVANNSRHVKDLYLIPLSAKDPVPSKLLPFEGPGLESPRPNIILGLVICQRIKRPSGAGELDKVEEKRTRPQTQEETEVSVYPKVSVAPQSERKPPRFQVGSGDMAVSTTPPGTPPPPPPPPEPPAASASSSVLKILSSLKPGAPSTVPTAPAAAALPTAAPSANSSTSKTASPLEHILQTLFGKKKSFDPPAREPAESAPASHPDPKAKADGGLPAAPLLDPIVQQFGQLSKDRALEDEEDDRPYDPEEEYGPERAFGAQLERGRRPDAEKAPETAEREEVAYDPEDETILEEATVAIDDLPNRMCADGKGGAADRPAEPAAPGAAPSLVEQQQMIEELNKQIEEQKRQVAEQEAALRQQRAAVGASMAHFSVADALMSPPPKASLPQAELFLQEQQTTGRPAALPGAPPAAGPGCDPRPSRDPRQARRLAAEHCESEAGSRPPAAREDGAEAALPAKPDGPKHEPSASPVVLPAEGGPPSAGSGSGSGSAPRPARRVLLPTPPSSAFQPGFPLQSAQSFPSPGARDPFSAPVCTAQEKCEDPRNAQFAEKGDPPAVEAEGDGEPPCRPGEGAATFPSAGQRAGAPLPPSQGQREPAPRTFGTSGLHGPSFPGPRGPAPPFSEENIVSNSDGPRGPPPARFGAQKGPIPSLFSGPHGPPPYGDSRGPSPSHLGGPRGSAPPQFEERKDPHGEKREFQDGPYDEPAGPVPQFEGAEQSQFVGGRGAAPFQFGGQRRPLLSQFKGPRGGPPPPQFGGQRGPPPGHFVGPRGPHPNQFEGPRGQAPNFMPGPRGVQPQPFEEQRVSSPPRFANPRAPAPLPFGGPRGSVPFPEKSEPTPPRFHFQGPPAPGLKAAPRPLLELPSHPPPHRPERWDEAPVQGPEPEFREAKGHDYRSAAFEGRSRERFEAGPKEKPLDEPEAAPESRPGRALDERRRERGRRWSRERDWERGHERARHRDKDAGREWDRSRERGADRDRGRDPERASEWGRSRERSRNRERERRRERERSRSRERGRDRTREHGRERKDRSKSKEGSRDPKADAPRAATPAGQN
ncbi:death-inducer obliterator 1 isoform X1 [Mustela putorius furo]|uniref:Death-inducer obliterator 1 n=1 Tax=Mustela putorius furo TaxID=9669 RepID=A0A8U0US00_MUSPF|nr:death-inducer obliterator 1 isoform X1 [Mustela putorius furo]XP_012915605.1 death-inducer obliterator 1 isoform X1 [Mustela putorius furo]XP_012915606.1 death-inducer obliterator 1 isoform X1 [Mustela putorius furo]XP_044926475.1 death-inducer obliterator 1 isoform X1 [Mustela putorius furo]XP_044926476.1 death-inducer obliterator 1 isoform X1 [Mustela putorius furo]XP_044926477.1 death-inducer obliterator 1 isoform X1 [Mustela putorius furo]XP_044926478.1 death-inducer obliterator 1 isof